MSGFFSRQKPLKNSQNLTEPLKLIPRLVFGSKKYQKSQSISKSLIQVRHRETAFPARVFYVQKFSQNLSHFLSSSLTTSSANSGDFPYSRLRNFSTKSAPKGSKKLQVFSAKPDPNGPKKTQKGPCSGVAKMIFFPQKCTQKYSNVLKSTHAPRSPRSQMPGM